MIMQMLSKISMFSFRTKIFEMFPIQPEIYCVICPNAIQKMPGRILAKVIPYTLFPVNIHSRNIVVKLFLLVSNRSTM